MIMIYIIFKWKNISRRSISYLERISDAYNWSDHNEMKNIDIVMSICREEISWRGLLHKLQTKRAMICACYDEGQYRN